MCRMRHLLPCLMLSAWTLTWLTACSPQLNWREIDGVEGGRWWFPCKPDRIERSVSIEGQPVPARLAVCDAQGASWSTMALQFDAPAQAAAALEPARLTLMMNLQAAEMPAPKGLVLPSAAPGWLQGRRPGGEPLQAAVQFRVQGRWLVQQVLMVNVSGDWPKDLRADVLEPFFAGAMPR